MIALNRRDFLKLAASLPLLHLGWTHISRRQALLDASARVHQDQPNVLVLIFDALSALNMSLYGYSRETTPNIARFADRATVYHRHYSAGNFTTSGTASLLTGLYPWTHRAWNFFGKVDASVQDRNIFQWMDRSAYTFAYTHNPLVAILLHQFGSQIDGLTKMGDLSVVSDTLSEQLFPADFPDAFWSELIVRGLNQPFSSSLYLSIFDKRRQLDYTLGITQELEELFPRGVPNNFNGLIFTLETAIDWTLSQAGQAPEPYFGYVHFWPPHEPYTTRREYIDRFSDRLHIPAKPVHFSSEANDQNQLDDLRRQYDEYIAYVDGEFGRLVDTLEGHGRLENTYLILTSDHGQLFERGIHGHLTPALYEPILRVPLLIAAPGQSSRLDVHTATSSVDLLPTLMYITGQETPGWCEGAVLPPFGDAPGNDRSLYAVEAKNNPKKGPLVNATVSLVKDGYKLIHYIGHPETSPSFELYNLVDDPDERIDLQPRNPAIYHSLREELLDTALG